MRTDCSGKCQAGDIRLFGDSWGWQGDVATGNYGFRCLRSALPFFFQHHLTADTVAGVAKRSVAVLETNSAFWTFAHGRDVERLALATSKTS